MTDIERVTDAINWLIFKKKVKSRRDLAQQMGYTESALSQMLNGKVALSERFIKKLAIFDKSINENWLLTGEESMLAVKNSSQLEVHQNSGNINHVIGNGTKVENDGISVNNGHMERLLGIIEKQNTQIEKLQLHIESLTEIIIKQK